MEPYSGVDYNSPFLVSHLCSQLSTPATKGKWWSGEDLCTLLISKTTNSEVQRREGVRADLMSLNRHFMEHGQPHALADFNPIS